MVYVTPLKSSHIVRIAVCSYYWYYNFDQKRLSGFSGPISACTQLNYFRPMIPLPRYTVSNLCGCYSDTLSFYFSNLFIYWCVDRRTKTEVSLSSRSWLPFLCLRVGGQVTFSSCFSCPPHYLLHSSTDTVASSVWNPSPSRLFELTDLYSGSGFSNHALTYIHFIWVARFAGPPVSPLPGSSTLIRSILNSLFTDRWLLQPSDGTEQGKQRMHAHIRSLSYLETVSWRINND